MGAHILKLFDALHIFADSRIEGEEALGDNICIFLEQLIYFNLNLIYCHIFPPFSTNSFGLHFISLSISLYLLHKVIIAYLASIVGRAVYS